MPSLIKFMTFLEANTMVRITKGPALEQAIVDFIVEIRAVSKTEEPMVLKSDKKESIMKWLRKLLGLCQHHWVIIRKVDIHGNEDYNGSNLPLNTDFILQCDVCGNIKVKRT